MITDFFEEQITALTDFRNQLQKCINQVNRIIWLIEKQKRDPAVIMALFGGGMLTLDTFTKRLEGVYSIRVAREIKYRLLREGRLQKKKNPGKLNFWWIGTPKQIRRFGEEIKKQCR